MKKGRAVERRTRITEQQAMTQRGLAIVTAWKSQAARHCAGQARGTQHASQVIKSHFHTPAIKSMLRETFTLTCPTPPWYFPFRPRTPILKSLLCKENAQQVYPG